MEDDNDILGVSLRKMEWNPSHERIKVPTLSCINTDYFRWCRHVPFHSQRTISKEQSQNKVCIRNEDCNIDISVSSYSSRVKVIQVLSIVFCVHYCSVCNIVFCRQKPPTASTADRARIS